MELRMYRKALIALKKARDNSPGRPDPAVERLIGEVYFRNGDYKKAYRHLKPLTKSFRGQERDRLFMRLSICAYRKKDTRRGQHFWNAIRNRADPEIQELERRHLGSRDATVAKAKPRVRSKAKRRWRKRGKLLIHNRSEWNARPVRRNVDRMSQISRITVHHTGDKLHHSSSQRVSAREIKKIQKYHQQQNGWADIGYHFVIDQNGRIWEGRPLRYQGAHARGHHNVGNVGVVLLGNFLLQKPSKKQFSSLDRLLVDLCRRHRVPPHRVHTHSELLNGETQCPGPVISRWLSRFRQRGIALAK